MLNLTVIDTPGYGDAINNEERGFRCSTILVEMQRYFEHEQDLQRHGPVVDSRVHACLYFLAPHRMKEADIEFMKRLSGIVNLIPVIAKADTMTIDETSEYKQLIRNQLREHNIITYLRHAEDTPSTTPPFAVIGSNDTLTLQHPILNNA